MTVQLLKTLKALGYDTFLEIGPSKILKDLVLKIDPNTKAESTALFADLETLIQNI